MMMGKLQLRNNVPQELNPFAKQHIEEHKHSSLLFPLFCSFFLVPIDRRNADNNQRTLYSTQLDSRNPNDIDFNFNFDSFHIPISQRTEAKKTE